MSEALITKHDVRVILIDDPELIEDAKLPDGTLRDCEIQVRIVGEWRGFGGPFTRADAIRLVEAQAEKVRADALESYCGSTGFRIIPQSSR